MPSLLNKCVMPILMAFCLSLSATCFAEIFELKDGRTIEGDVTIETPDLIMVKTPTGNVSFKPTEVKSRKKSLDKREEYRQKLNAVLQKRAQDAEAWRELARWCKTRGLMLESEQCYSRLAAIKPDDEEATKALEPDPAARIGLKLRRKLETTPVHFDFKMATVPTILLALSNASGVKVEIDKPARSYLKRKKLKLRYQTDHSAYRALADLTRSCKLEFLIQEEKVTVGTRKSIARLRSKLGLKAKRPQQLTAQQAKVLLEQSRHTLSLDKKPLSQLLAYVKKNTPLPCVYSGPKELLDKEITLETYQRPLGQVLDKALKPLGLDYMLQGHVILIASSETIARQKKAKR